MTDNELLERLSRAFAAEPVEPPPAGLYALRQAIETGRPQRRPTRRHPRVTAVAAVFATILAGSITAYALTGAPLPRPARVVAHGVGLPVDSVAVADTRHAADRLKDALAHHDPTQVDQAARQLRTRLAHLEPDEKSQIEHQTSELLQAAGQTDGQDANQHQEQTGLNPSAPPSAPLGPSGGGSGTARDEPVPGNPGNGGQHNNDTPGDSSGTSSSVPGNANQGTAGPQTPPPDELSQNPPTTPPPAPQSTEPPRDTGGPNQNSPSADNGTG